MTKWSLTASYKTIGGMATKSLIGRPTWVNISRNSLALDTSHLPGVFLAITMTILGQASVTRESALGIERQKI
jgi:hypothetical protein